MRVLGLDTATPIASVALVEDGVVTAEKRDPPVDRAGSRRNLQAGRHAAVLFSLIDAVLAESRISLDQLSGLAVSIGPGSFTGLRIGLSAIKGIAFGSPIPVVGVSTLRAVAGCAGAWQGLVCPMLDARKEEVYAALFESSGGKLARLMPDTAATPSRFLQQTSRIASSGRCLFLGAGAELYRATLERSLGPGASVIESAPERSVGAAVALIGAEKLARGDRRSADELAPVYLRPSDAQPKIGKIGVK